MKWQDAWDARPSKNARGEDVFDIYRKDTDQMVWADIAPDQVEKLMKDMLAITKKAAEEQFDALFEETDDV